MLDVVLPAVSGPLGLVCCQGVGVVLVDTVVPMSPAYRADLRRDDVVLAIDNKPVNNVAQVTLPSVCFMSAKPCSLSEE